jgi:hypothetical protein
VSVKPLGGKVSIESAMLRFMRTSKIELFAHSNRFIANKTLWFDIGEIWEECLFLCPLFPGTSIFIFHRSFETF